VFPIEHPKELYTILVFSAAIAASFNKSLVWTATRPHTSSVTCHKRIQSMNIESRRKLVPVISNAIIATFEKGDWKSLGYATETEHDIDRHPRLLRSLSWGDPDYDGCVFDMVEQIYDLNENNAKKLLSNDKIKQWIKDNNPKIYREFYDSGFVEPFIPKKQWPSDIVETALKDAEVLLATNGPVSAIDRAHTALHGYLKSACDHHFVPYGKDAGVTELYKNIRQNVAAIKEMGERSEDLNKMLRSLMSVLDALNPIRNRASIAHANENLLGKEEAMFTINIISSVLHYLDAKLYN